MSKYNNIGAMFSYSWESDGRKNNVHLIRSEENDSEYFVVLAIDADELVPHYRQIYTVDEFHSACRDYELIVKTSLLGK